MPRPDGWEVLEGGLSKPPPTDPDDPGPQSQEPNAPPEWKASLLLTEQGSIRSCMGNALSLFRNHPDLKDRLRWDERRQAAEWIAPPPWRRIDSEPSVVDLDSVEASAWVASALRSSIAHTHMFEAMVTEAKRRSSDPVRVYLESLEWDGHPRAQKWLTAYMGTQSTRYSDAVGLAWLVSAVARTMKPGCQADHMLVIEGVQGVGKSRSLSALAQPWYVEISIDTRSPDSALALHGPWIVEWSELAGLSRRESEATKAFLSRRTDWLRPPYGRSHISLPRRCVVAGTTNESTYVNDQTGNRRYWPVRACEVCRMNPDRLALERDQIWAEAVKLYRSGAKWWLTDELEAIARSEQEKRLEPDVWEETIRDHLVGLTETTVREVLNKLELPASAQGPGTARRIDRIMRRLKWSAVDLGDQKAGRIYMPDGE